MKHCKLILILFCVTTVVKAQNCWNTLNTITTKWNEAGTANIQNWDWTLEGDVHPVYLQNNMDLPSFLVELPYFCSNAPGSGSCQNDNTMQYEILANNGEQQDIYPENGWELVLKNFGTQNTNVGSNDGKGTTIPVFILYNKHTGRMKVFVALIGNMEANSAYLKISFDDNTNLKRAVFAHADISVKTLQVFDNTLHFKTLNSYAQKPFPTSYQWLVSEIQSAYDPCTCNDQNQSATISITPYVINHSTIEATVEGTSVQSLADNQGIKGENDGKTSFFDLAVGAGKAGIKGYTDFSGYNKKVNDILNNKNAAYKNKLVKEWFDEYVKENPQYQGVNNLNDKFALWDALGRTDDAYKKSIGIPDIDFYQTNSTYQNVKTIASFLPYVGTAIGLVDFLMAGGKKTEPPKPSPPMVFNLSLKLNGSIINPKATTPVSFNLPGHKTTGSPHLTPIYNNILGVFNILKEPQVNAVKVMKNVTNNYVYDIKTNKLITDFRLIYYNIPEQNDIRKSDWQFSAAQPILKQYKLNEDLKYIVNPASELTVEAIDACMIFEYEFNNVVDLFISDNRLDNRTQNAIHKTNSLPFYPGMFNRNLTFEERIKEIEDMGLDLEYISQTEKIIRFRTKYVPLTCLKNQSITLLAGKSPKVMVKMLVKFKRVNEPNSESVTQIVTYDISSSFETPNYLEYETSINIQISDLSRYGEIMDEPEHTIRPQYWIYDYVGIAVTMDQNLTLPSNLPFTNFPTITDYTYNGGIIAKQVNGIITIPDNTFVQSGTWLKAKSFVLGNNITVDDNVTIISSDPIEIKEESVIHPDAQIKIEKYGNMEAWNCPDVRIRTIEATEQEIRDICINQTYRQRVLNKKEEAIGEGHKSPIKDQVNLSPNPASDIITISLNLDNDDNLKISIIDMTGKEILKSISIRDVAKNSMINIETKDLSNGIYFCNIQLSSGEQITKKFVIAK